MDELVYWSGDFVVVAPFDVDDAYHIVDDDNSDSSESEE